MQDYVQSVLKFGVVDDKSGKADKQRFICLFLLFMRLVLFVSVHKQINDLHQRFVLW